jgi:HAD superfamily hydrolase (TIGR01549 family)
MDPTRRARSLAVIERHERIAAEESELQSGVHELLAFLRARRIGVAISTRNSRSSALTVLAKHALTIDLLDTREDGPVKPAPDPVCRICARLDVSTQASWMVGDYVYDMESGRRAGATTVLMLGERAHCTYADQADFVVRDLRELMNLIGAPHAADAH